MEKKKFLIILENVFLIRANTRVDAKLVNPVKR